MVIQVYAPTSNAEEAEVERFYADLPTGPFRTNTQKDVLFIVGLHRTVQLQLLQHYWLGHRLGLL